MTIEGVVWRDFKPNRVLNASVAGVGYGFFWFTELLLLFWLVQELLAKTQWGFIVAGGLVLAWTVISAYATMRLHRMTLTPKVLYLTQEAIGFTWREGTQLSFPEVDKIIVAHSYDGFEVQVTGQETEFRVPLRDRAGFLEACKGMGGLREKVASTGVLDE